MWTIDRFAVGSGAKRHSVRLSPSYNVALWTLLCGLAKYYILDGLYVSAEITLYWVLGTAGLCCSLPIHLYFTPPFALTHIHILTTLSPLTGTIKPGNLTIVMQMKIIHQNGFLREELPTYLMAIYRNLVDSALDILQETRKNMIDCEMPSHRVSHRLLLFCFIFMLGVIGHCI
jgi:hypothetical protein